MKIGHEVMKSKYVPNIISIFKMNLTCHNLLGVGSAILKLSRGGAHPPLVMKNCVFYCYTGLSDNTIAYYPFLQK